MIAPGAVSILGAGPTGALLAIFLKARGLDVTLYEGRADPRAAAGDSGRSINLALADRGIHALKLAGVYDAIISHLKPMRGRTIHAADGGESFFAYGQRPNEIIYSVSRDRLNRALLDVAMRRDGIPVKFEHRLDEVNFDTGIAGIRDLVLNRVRAVPMRPLLATDGAGSVMRRRMAAAGLIEAAEIDLAHGYKELSIPADPNGAYRLTPDALHIWPRGDFMLIALPNTDGSFTATLFLANHGAVSFDALATPAAIDEFLTAHFPDVVAWMPDRIEEFCGRPTGFLGTVHASGWSVRDTAALVGDAAHAIVPFHGQGMNCCFEDCVEFDGCVARQSTWDAVFADFFARRKPDCNAIAAMALENYREMRERVAEPRFQLQQQLALELERRHPRSFVPRYSMVMFHHDIPYHVALHRGEIQTQLLVELTTQATTLADIDYARAEREIALKLPPILAAAAPM